MENRKQIMIGVLSVIVCIMAVGYAYLSQQLTVNGTAHIDSKWDVRISNITAKVNGVAGGTTPTDNAINEGCSTTTAPSGCTGTTASFDASLFQPGDSITYTVTVANYGTLPAGLDTVTPVYKRTVNNVETVVQNNSSDAIVYTIDENLTQFKEIPARVDENTPSTITFTVTATYNSDITAQPSAEQLSKKLELTLNFVQDMHTGDTTQN